MKRSRYHLKYHFLRIIRDCAVCFLLLLNIASAASRQEPFSTAQSVAPPPGQPEEIPPSSQADDSDWIQLTSGEWLRGEIKSLYNDELQFDSIKLDLLELDWDNIIQLHGHHAHSARFEGGPLEKDITARGVLTVVDGTVYVDTEDGILEFDRSRLFSISAGEARYIRSWSAKVSFSMGVRKGNSEQIDFNSTARLERFTSRKRVSFEYIGIFNKTDGTEVANSQRLTGYYDIFRTTRFFWRPVFGEYFHDPVSNIQSRFSIGSGLGYRFIYTPRTKLDMSAGIAYQHTQNVSWEAGQTSHVSTPALVLVSDYKFEWTDDIDFNATYTLDIVNEDSGEYWHHAVTGLEIEVTSRLDLDLSLIWDRIKNPKEKEDGLAPARDDYHFIIGIGFKY